MLNTPRDIFNNFSRIKKRGSIATVLFFDALILGLLYQFGFLNIIDKLVGGGLPNDSIWIMQVLESISAGFILIKIIIDDFKPGILRSVAMFFSPLIMLITVLITLEFLFQGLEKAAFITFDPVQIALVSLTWASTYLAISIGLTLTYKVQRYGNFAQSEFFMIGMYLAMIMAWSEHYYPIQELSQDGVLAYSLLCWTLLAAFILTGIAGIIIDQLVYRGFRKDNASPQVMMIASLGVALILRAIIYLRFGASNRRALPDLDWGLSSLRWELPTTKFRFNIGQRSLTEGKTYTQQSCEQTGIDSISGEPILSRIVSDVSKPILEIYGKNRDCVTDLTFNQAYYKGIVPIVIFSSVLIFYYFLVKTRLGRRMRAVADNPELAASSGINVENIQIVSSFLSAGISGLGGAIFAISVTYNPEVPFTLLLPSFAVIVLGTIGSIPGAIMASLIVGLVRSVSSPILAGIGFSLSSPIGSRSSYYQFELIIPYLFLVAVLLVLPEGIGNSFEKWKIDRLRNLREKNKKPSKLIYAILAIFPLTGILGLHHWYNNRSDKTQTVASITLGAYFYHKVATFLGTQSFAEGACADICISQESITSNREVITGGDGLQVTDSPYFIDAVSNIDTSWFELMQTEMWFMDLIISIDGLIWPTLPLFMILIAVFQGLNLYLDNKFSDYLTPIKFKIISIRNIQRTSDKFNKIQLSWDKIQLSWDKINHQQILLLNNIGSKLNQIKESIIPKNDYLKTHPLLNSIIPKYGRESPKGSRVTFLIFMAILLLFLYWLPVSESDQMNFIKTLQVSNVLLTLSIFILMSFCLNLHTGVTGMVNFGIIFFVGIGAMTVGILTTSPEVNGYGWNILPATIVAVLVSAAFGWALAYPTARLRMDYFAIVTISLGELLRSALANEPLFRSGTSSSSAAGISNYPLPLQQWWFCGSGIDIGEGTNYVSANSCKLDSSLLAPANKIGDILNLGEPAPYMLLLAFMSLLTVISIWWLLETVISSPWGRILKSIREDEDVSQHHGHNVLSHKAGSLALGAAIAGLAGAFWAWKLTGFFPSFLSPARSTFLVWAAFIIGGSGNNKGMIIGAFIIVLMEFVFNVLVAGQGSPDLPLYATADKIDRLFEWLIINQLDTAKIFLILTLVGLSIRNRLIIALGISFSLIFIFTHMMLGQNSIDQVFTNGIIKASMSYVKLLLVGCLMLFSLKLNPKGIVPEVPFRPSRELGGEVK
jgi:neutral amino acid transport system permease protein|tara:strand:- start:1690 stop:5358 length:3669 start_codon:yes stop_codon:yes gene_type:complete